MKKLEEIEQYCRKNWNYINKEQKNSTTINLDYTDGLKQAFREIIDTYFGGL